MEFRKSFSLVWNKLGFSMLCVLIDLLFFFALGFFTAPISARMGELLIDFTAVFSMGIKNLDRSDSLSSILFGADVLPFWKSFLGYALLFVLIIYLVYVIFQSFAWFVSMKIAGKKVLVWPFFRKFLLFNLFWFLLFVVYNVIDLLSDLSAVLGSKGFSIIPIICNIFLLVLVYFAVISYIKLDFKSAFVLGWKKYRQILPSFLVVFLYFFALNIILPPLFNLNYYLGVVLGIVLFLPALVLARVFMILAVERAK